MSEETSELLNLEAEALNAFAASVTEFEAEYKKEPMQVKVHGIQEKDEEIRAEERQYFRNHMDEMLAPFKGWKLMEAEGECMDMFDYYRSLQYLRGKNIPMKLEEFMVEACPFLEKHTEISHEDKPYSLKEQSIRKLYLRKGMEFARLYQEAYLNKETIDRGKIKTWLRVVNQGFQNRKKVLLSFFGDADICNKEVSKWDWYHWVEYDEERGIRLRVGGIGAHFSYQNGAFYDKKGTQVHTPDWVASLPSHLRMVYDYMGEVKKLFLNDGHETRCYATDNEITVEVAKQAKVFAYDEHGLKRLSGERILDLGVIAYEMYDLLKEVHVYQQRAKEMFLATLNDKEQAYYKKHGVVELEGHQNVYILVTHGGHNNLIQIPKTATHISEAKSLCIMAANPRVPKFDVYAHIVVALKAGHEKMILENSNPFHLGQYFTYAESYFKRLIQEC